MRRANTAAALSIVLGLNYAAPHQAHAQLPPVLGAVDRTCGPMTMFMGQEGRAHVVSTDVVHDGSEWRIIHHMSDGRSYSRVEQYNIEDQSTGAQTGWIGAQFRNTNISMNGVLSIYHGQIQYDEFVYNAGRMVAHSAQLCGYLNDAPSPPPTYTAQASATTSTDCDRIPAYLRGPSCPAPPDVKTIVPAPTNSQSDAVPIIVAHDAARINVMLGGRALAMIIDTGATSGNVPETFANSLITDGTATEGPTEQVTLADGSTITARTITVHEVVIGGHTVHDVRFGIAPDGAEPLLGFNALSAVGTFKIDSVRGVLSFN